MLTVSKVADLVGVSRVALYNRIKKGEFDNCLVKENNTTYLTDEGFEKVKKIYANKVNCKPSVNIDKVNSNVNSSLIADLKKQLQEKHDYITIFQNELDNKNKQLDTKDKQIEELNKILVQSQQLNENNQILLREANKKVLLLEERTTKKWWKFWN